MRAVTAAVGIKLDLEPRWRGGQVDRLLDRAHAELADTCARVLHRAGWDLLPELTFSRYGERGSIDLLAWHPPSRALLVIEVKTRILDLQATLAGIDRKCRLAPSLVVSRGWHAASVSRVLVAAELRANRSIVARHSSLLRAAMPAGSWEIRKWLRRPSGPVGSIWFLSLSGGAGAKRDSVTRLRVRRVVPSSGASPSARPARSTGA